MTFKFYGWNAEAAGGTFSIDSVTFSGSVSLATGIGSVNFDLNSNFNVYPVPCNDGVIFIENKHAIEVSKIELMDILGNVVQCPVVRMDFTNYAGISELESQFNVNAYPNPFNASTEVAFELKNEATVSVSVSDITGREVLSLGSTNYTAGKHTVAINGADLIAGVYNYSIKIGNSVITKRIVKK